jgi:gamma-glutamyl hercynylcysteine S-oxide hydrolase
MCRHVAYLGPPVPLASLLYDPPQSLLRQSWAPRQQRHGTVNADGYGVGWYQPDIRPEPARFRRAGPMWADRSLESLARLVRSGAVVAAVRSATPPAPIEETGAAPFTDGRWLFSLNGAVSGDLTLLRSRVSARRQAGIQGASDAEVLFALLLDRLDRLDRLDGLDGLAGSDGSYGPDGPAGSDGSDGLGEGLGGGKSPATALRDLVAAVPGPLNMLLCDGTTIWATKWGDSLWWRSTVGGDPTVLVASEPLDDDPCWVALPDRSLLTAAVCPAEGTVASSVVALPAREEPAREEPTGEEATQEEPPEEEGVPVP